MSESAKTIHEKAIRLIEGGVVEISGMSVIMRHEPYIFDPCYGCDMDCLCHKGNDICNLCEECDTILGEDCYLIPYTAS